MAATALPEIKEEDAEGDIAALYDDVRAVIGVPMVNLIFRHMATVPGCLLWAWATIRPLYLNSAIPNAAAALTTEVMPGQAVDLSPAINTAHLSPSDIHGIGQVLDAYGRANPMNLIGLQVIDLALDSAAQKPALDRVKPLSIDALSRPPDLRPLLPMADPATASPQTRDALKRLAHQIHRADTGVIPSLYRHFGDWPGFLDALEPALNPLLQGDRFEGAVEKMQKNGAKVAAELYWSLPLPDMTPPDSETKAALKKLIGQFPTNICRMTVLATVLGRGLAIRD